MDTLACIGRGGYGVVHVAKWEGQLVAVKSVRKSGVQYRHELSIMRRVKSPFVVQLVAAYETDKELHLVMQYLCGGDLFRLVVSPEWRPTREVATFYLAQIALTLKFLHYHTILFGDLKLENIMLDARGYIRLVDFGMARHGVKKTHGAQGVGGSLHTAAPELLRGEDTYGLAVDVWALGCVAYELFTKNYYDPKDADCKLVHDEQARAFVQFLLDEDAETRPVMNEVVDHAFFKQVDWSALKLKTLRAPWKPDANKLYVDDEFSAAAVDVIDLDACAKVF